MTGQVLLVDDDSDVREAYGQSLELSGFDVTVCRAWIEAADHLRPGWPGVVVTDVKMPGRDGFDVLARIKILDAKGIHLYQKTSRITNQQLQINLPNHFNSGIYFLQLITKEGHSKTHKFLIAN